MKIYLVQHAVAKSEDEDPNRPLTEAGILDAEKIGAFIGALAFSAADCPTGISHPSLGRREFCN